MSDNVLRLAQILLDGIYNFFVVFLTTPAGMVFIGLVTMPFLLLFSRLLAGIGKKSRKPKIDICAIDRMNGEEFELFLEGLFAKLNYHVERTQYSGDYGADLVILKNATRTVVQAKRWSNKVGVQGIQEVVAAKGHYRAEKAMLVTNNYLTAQAHKLAKTNNVEIWDRDMLISILATHN